MAVTTGGRLAARALKEAGIEVVFTLSGGHIVPLYYGLREQGIELIDVRHENSGGFAADAYARVSGKLGCFVATAGPGVVNASTAMAEARENGTPLLFIGGASPVAEDDTSPLQNTPTLEGMAAYCKFAKQVKQVERIPEYITMAVRAALSGTPGPAYVQIGEDLMDMKVEEDKVFFPQHYRAIKPPAGDPSLIEEAAEALANAKQPAMIIGDEARFSAGEYAKSVEELANYLKIPVYVLNTSRGVFADESKNPLFQTNLGRGAMPDADVIIELGHHRTYRTLKGRSPLFNRNAIRISVNTDDNQIGFNAPSHIGIVAGAGIAAKQILDLVKTKRQAVTNEEFATRYGVLKERRAAAIAPLTEAEESQHNPPHPGKVASEVMKFIQEEAPDWHVICDGGDASVWMDDFSVATYPGQLVRWGPLGTIGTGNGFGLGAYFADGKPSVIFTGDGSFGFHAMEFDTYVRHKIPVICVISNDSAWGMIRNNEISLHPEDYEKYGSVGTGLEHMRAYHKLAEIWGGVGVAVNHIDDVIPAMRKIRESGLPGIVNVQVDEKPLSRPILAAAKGREAKRKAGKELTGGVYG